jgi:hypothetical protein
MEQDKFIFILQTVETEEFFAGRKENIEPLIRKYEEEPDEDLPFTTVAKIKEPPQGLPMGFEERLIQWLEPNKVPDSDEINGAVMAVVQFLQNGFIL